MTTYVVTYRNPNDISRGARVEKCHTRAGVNNLRRLAKQYPGSVVLESIEKINAKGVTVDAEWF